MFLLRGLLIVLGVLDLILGPGLALLFTLGGIGGLAVGDPSGWILLGIGLGLLAVVIPWTVFRRRGRRERPGRHAAGED
jgi:hypothetical protein